MAKNFKELQAKMSPERREAVRARVKTELSQELLRDLNTDATRELGWKLKHALVDLDRAIEQATRKP
jgi:hypothetical protein